MDKLLRLPPEIIAKIFKYLPLKDLYLLLDDFKSFINIDSHVITSQLDSSFVKSFKNVTHIEDFQNKSGNITESSFIFIFIATIHDLQRWNDEFSHIYFTLSERKKSMVFIMDNQGVFNYHSDTDCIIHCSLNLFSTNEVNSCLIILKNLQMFEFPWIINFLNKSKILNNQETFQYLLHNLITDHPKPPSFNNWTIPDKKTFVSDLMNLEYEEEPGNFDIKENIMLTDTDMITINISTDDSRQIRDMLHPRIINAIRSSLKTVEKLDVCISHRLLQMNHANVINEFFQLSSNLFAKVHFLEIHFYYQLNMNNFSFPNLEKLVLKYSIPDITTDHGNETYKDISKLLKENPLQLINIKEINAPNLKILEILDSEIRSILVESTSTKNILTFSRKDSSDFIDETSYLLPQDRFYKNFNKELKISPEDLFISCLNFGIVGNIKEFKIRGNDELTILNKIIAKIGESNFPKIEELSISILVFNNIEQDWNQCLEEAFKLKTFYKNLNKLSINLSGNGDHICVPTLLENNLPQLSELNLKGKWNNHLSKSLQILSIPQLTFTNLNSLTIESLIFTNFSSIRLPSVTRLCLKDVYEDENLVKFTITGVLPRLRSLKLYYTDALIRKYQPSFYVNISSRHSVTYWSNSFPIIVIDQKIHNQLVNLECLGGMINLRVMEI